MFSDYIAEKTGFRVQFDIEQLKPDLNVDATDRFQQQNLGRRVGRLNGCVIAILSDEPPILLI
ncbi:hypothetical protein IE978_03035 [Klebsiella pneumoniae]|uniref:Uncharacterized protein n=1 Tax=Klebsiella pneumoniae TaxID=573 RepID=A0A927DEK7_KLEPN|nr:hypothetical protein [Klebsiella pneumoniae]MBD3722058.1 hypothetical protein [Klebsiella pneumoniae]